MDYFDTLGRIYNRKCWDVLGLTETMKRNPSSHTLFLNLSDFYQPVRSLGNVVRFLANFGRISANFVGIFFNEKSVFNDKTICYYTIGLRFVCTPLSIFHLLAILLLTVVLSLLWHAFIQWVFSSKIAHPFLSSFMDYWYYILNQLLSSNLKTHRPEN